MDGTALTPDWVVGIDVGGTFTDIIGLDRATGEMRDGKVLSTREQEVGVLEALDAIGVSVVDVSEIVHGHTVGINALLSRAGSRTGLLATRGHRDLLDIGRMNREFGENFYDPTWLRPHQERPIVERRDRIGIPERIGSDGSVLLDLDEDAVRAAARELADRGVESVAVCFMNSYVNPAHEQRAAQIVAEVLPDAYVQTSALYPVTKEHERTTTVALDSYVGPAVTGYLGRLREALQQRDYTGTLWIMMMNGGVVTFEDACRAPVFQLVSGPVGGVSATIQTAQDTGELNLLTMDVGGTSTDVACISEGRTPLTDLWTLEQGLTLTMPLVDVGSVGSGAGSIIGPDALGKISVGPRSAGSNPGPVCYGRGGTEPTLTDACAVLGILQPDLFANGALHLDVAAAAEALGRAGERWGLTGLELAEAAYQVACEDIASKIRSISVYRGIDIRDYALLPFGSAGPMLADRVGGILGVGKVIVPTTPGQFSAMGLLRSDLRMTRASSPMVALEPGSAEAIEAAFRAIEESIRADLGGQGVDLTHLSFDRAIFAMYKGQTWDNRMPVEPTPVSYEVVPALVSDFHAFYQDSYGFSAEDLPVILSSVEVTAVIPRGVRLPAPEPTAGADALIRTAQVALPGMGSAVTVPVYRREDLRAHDVVVGPALVSEKFATTLVLPQRKAYVDDSRLLIVETS